MRPYFRWAAVSAVAALTAFQISLPPVGAQSPTKADPAFWLNAFSTHQSMEAASAYKALMLQSIGPSNNTGRMTSIAVGDRNGQRVIYVGAASGGVWKSTDRGDTWAP